jgi:hypothetical protein
VSGGKAIPTIEDEILLWAAGGEGEGAAAWVPIRLDPEESASLVERAVAEGMAGLLCRRLLTGRRMEILAEKERARLRSIYYLTLQTNLRYLEVLKEILSSFQSARVPAVVIQGMALLITLYQDPGERPVSDIDLWLLPGSLAPAAALLEHLGFRAVPLYPRLFRRGEVLIDLHTHFLGVERIGAWRHLLQIDQEAIFEESGRRVQEGVELRLLAPADQVIYLTIHAVKHNLERLVWMADLRRLTAGWGAAEWEGLGRRAAEIGQPRIPALLEGLHAACGSGSPASKFRFCGSGFQPRSSRQDAAPTEKILICLKGLLALVAGGGAVAEIPPALLFQRGVKVEEKVLPAGRGLSVLERHLLRRRRRGPLPKWSFLFLLHAGGRLKQLAFAIESMFPRPAVLRQVFPGREELKNWQLYVLRIRQLLGMLR